MTGRIGKPRGRSKKREPHMKIVASLPPPPQSPPTATSDPESADKRMSSSQSTTFEDSSTFDGDFGGSFSHSAGYTSASSASESSNIPHDKARVRMWRQGTYDGMWSEDQDATVDEIEELLRLVAEERVSSLINTPSKEPLSDPPEISLHIRQFQEQSIKKSIN